MWYRILLLHDEAGEGKIGQNIRDELVSGRA